MSCITSRQSRSTHARPAEVGELMTLGIATLLLTMHGTSAQVTWVDRSPEPSPRYRAAAAYDPARRVTVLFGGSRGWPSPPLADTWAWDGSGWKQRPVSSPAARGAHQMTYDF